MRSYTVNICGSGQPYPFLTSLPLPDPLCCVLGILGVQIKYTVIHILCNTYSCLGLQIKHTVMHILCNTYSS